MNLLMRVFMSQNKPSEVDRNEKRFVLSACQQGCRMYNEDRIHVDPDCPVNVPNFNVFSVLDGHGGIECVDALRDLMKEMLNSKKRLQRGLEPIQYYNCFFVLQSFYEKARKLLENKTSGVVSIVALVSKRKVVFGWLGDCEGCVFVNGKDRFFDPIYQNEITQFNELDLAEREYATREYLAHRRMFGLKSQAKTRSHSFNKSVDSAFMFGSEFYPVASYKQVCKVIPERFMDPDAEKEYELMSLKKGSKVELDITKYKLGFYEQILDTRLSRAIQPTRSLGDNSECNDFILRECSILEVDLDSYRCSNFQVLLCSDGLFHGGAFASIDKVCSCFIDPSLFVRMYLYHCEQEVTLRMMACGLLPSLREGWENISVGLYPHLDQWKQCGPQAIISFLTLNHLEAISSEAFRRTYDACCVQCYEEWLGVCKQSCVWLNKNISCTTNDIATFVSHLAILMGSQDNISVLVANV